MSATFSLVVVKGTGVGKTHSFVQSVVYIGRSAAANDFVINDKSVSGKHARITYEDGDYFLQDLGSANGTFYKWAPLREGERIKINHRDEFSLGKVAVQFLDLSVEESEEEARREGEAADATRIVEKDSEADEGKTPLQKMLKRKPFKIAIAVFLVLFVLLFIVKLKSGGPGDKLQDYSSKAIPIPAKGVYGYMQKMNKPRKDKAVFMFTAESKRAELVYTAGGINTADEVVVLLNGKQIGKVPIAKTWGKEQVLAMPRHLVKKGQENHIVFDNTKNPPGDSGWAVKNISLKYNTTGTCDMEKGRQLFGLAKEMYEERAVSAGNLFLACKYYNESIATVEECEDIAEYLPEAEIRLGKARKELDHRYQTLKFSYMKSLKMNNLKPDKKYLEQGKKFLEEMLALIPDSTDKRHIIMKNELNKMNRYFKSRKK